MKENQMFLISLLKKEIKKELYQTCLLNSLNKDFYRDISIYGLRGILYPSPLKDVIEDENQKKIHEDWTHYIKRNVMSNLLFIQQSKYIFGLFQEVRITPVIIKGLSIARLYKNPENRFMEDLDLLIHPDEWNRSKKLLSKHGYSQVNDDDYHPMHIKYTKVGGIPVELHNSLVHTGYLGEHDVDEWYQNIWKNKRLINVEETQLFSLAPEDELINQVVHFATHFVFYGVRLKHLFEISLIIESFNKEIDWRYVYDTLKKLNFYDFGNLIFSTCRKYFEVNVPEMIFSIKDERQKKFMEDFLDYYCTENVPYISGYLNILTRYRIIFKNQVLLQPLLWAIALKSQYNIFGFKIDMLLPNTTRIITHINKKIRVIRKFRLA